MSTNATNIPSDPPGWSPWRAVAGYAVMAVVFIGLILAVLAYGHNLAPAAAGAEAASKLVAPHKLSVLYHVLLALVSILLLGRWMGKLFVHFGQPRVIGEMVAGIMLGPSLLGQGFWPAAQHFMLPAEVGPYLGIIAQIGVILYMFLVGLELNAGLIRSKAHATVAISHTSILVPFLLGAILALWLFPHFAPAGTPFISFALFMGIAMSITAFPVLARILTDRHMENTELGVVALSCAAIDDVTAWCLLAFVVGVAQAEVGGAVQTILYAIGYIAIMLVVVRPLAVRFLGHDANAPQQPDGGVGAGGAVVFGDDGRVDRHPRDFRRVPAGGDHSARHRRGDRLPPQAGRHRQNPAAARVLRLHGHADRDRPRFRLAGVGLYGGDHSRRHARQVRRHAVRPRDSRASIGRCPRRSAC